MNFDQAPIPHRIHPLFLTYVKKMAPGAVIWSQAGTGLTARQVAQELEGNTSVGIGYAQELLCQLYAVVRGPHREASPAADTLDVTVDARSMFTPLFAPLKDSAVVWKTMSGNFTAAQLAQMVQAGHSDASHYIDGRLQLACDLVAADARRA